MSGGPCAVSEQANEWAVLDDLLGVETVNAPDNGVGALAFYGRCSTEDNQDPETSRRGRSATPKSSSSRSAAAIVAEYFDIGQSRSVPWERRTSRCNCSPS